MTPQLEENVRFVTLVRSPHERWCARMLIDSIRSFGGVFNRCPVWLFDMDGQDQSGQPFMDPDVKVLSLRVPENVRHFFFADKVFACSRAEAMAVSAVQSLIWIDPACLVINPPLLYELGSTFDAAVRPVHIQNVGLLPDEPLDGFWRGIFEVVGVEDIQTSVETFVDEQRIRSYFNSHAFAMKPSRGLLRRWFECFETLVGDEDYQMEACQDERHQIFLHQAIWSALLVAEVDSQQIRELPPDYNYPYNLHPSVPLRKRAKALNDLVTVAYERRSLNPGLMDDIDVHEPLRSWLSTHTA